jgi:hypothetical protein
MLGVSGKSSRPGTAKSNGRGEMKVPYVSMKFDAQKHSAKSGLSTSIRSLVSVRKVYESFESVSRGP